jgi:uncharacterized protein YndB with AHSA1/START domain
MPNALETTHSVTVEAPAEKVWDALTTPDLIKQWFFGVDTETDWKEGSTIVHRGEWQGKPYEDKGRIVKLDPPHTFVHTHWSPMSKVPDSEENYQEVTWSLAEKDGKTTLTVGEVNLPSEEAKSVSDQSWPMVLDNLKKLLEGRSGSWRLRGPSEDSSA